MNYSMIHTRIKVLELILTGTSWVTMSSSKTPMTQPGRSWQSVARLEREDTETLRQSTKSLSRTTILEQLRTQSSLVIVHSSNGVLQLPQRSLPLSRQLSLLQSLRSISQSHSLTLQQGPQRRHSTNAMMMEAHAQPLEPIKLPTFKS